MTTLDLPIPSEIPTRGAVTTLQRHIVEQIVRSRPTAGTSLMPAEAMAEHFGVSRSTMNRVLDRLHREGWIVRRAGLGTFIGPRAEFAMVPPAPAASEGKNQRMIRLALTVAPRNLDPHNWVSQELLEGVDAAASAEGGIAIELISTGNEGTAGIGRRLTQSNPDAIIVMRPPIAAGAAVIFEAGRLGIPCVVTGTRLREFGCTTVQEDGHQGVRDAVCDLARNGHTRIAFAVPDDAGHLWFDRRHGYQQGIADAGLPYDPTLVFWHPEGTSFFHYSEQILNFVRQTRATAMVIAKGIFAEAFVPLVQSGRIRIPEDFSLVMFDQAALSLKEMLGGRQPTIIELPTRAMATEAVRVARALIAKKDVPTITTVPCPLRAGETVSVLGGEPENGSL